MGNLFRQYWMPAIKSDELPSPDCPPVRIMLLGEPLIGFRTTSGAVGLMQNSCPHRGASMFFGRNEEEGLRCVYHGWKFDTTGQCVDMPSEPADSNFKDRVRIPAYPTYEAGGVVWAYMGPKDKQPAPPLFGWTQAPAERRALSKVWEECNWLQGLEGGIDTSHVPILHRVLSADSARPGFKPGDPFVRGKAPILELDVTDYGYRYAGLRPLDGDSVHVRAYHLILPFHQIRPGRTGAGDYTGVAGHIWVPMDDETTMVYNWEYSTTEPLTEEDRLERRLGNGPFDVDQTTFRSRRNRENNYLLDRRVQRTESFTGIDGVNVQDRAVQESMGSIVDRSLEHLGPADRAVIQARRLLLQAIKTVEAGGTPPGVEPTYYTLRPAEAVVPRDTDWRTLLAPEAPRSEVLQQV